MAVLCDSFSKWNAVFLLYAKQTTQRAFACMQRVVPQRIVLDDFKCIQKHDYNKINPENSKI